MNKCIKCGSETKEDHVTCEKCNVKEITKQTSKILIFVVICMLIGIIIVMLVGKLYNNEQEEILETNEEIVEQLPVVEVDWTIYEGKQEGTKIRNLINDLMRHGNFNKTEKDKVVNLEFLKEGEDVKVEYEGEEYLINYFSALNNLNSKIDISYKYNVELVYDETNTQVKLIKVSY